jgi:hypothetical protein
MEPMKLAATVALAIILAPASPSLQRKPAPTPSKPAPAPKKPANPMAFVPAELDLAPGETYPVELFVPSPTGKPVEGKLTYTSEDEKRLSVQADPRWTGKLSKYGAKTFPKVKALPGAAEGDVRLTAKFDKGGTATLLVRLAAPKVEPIPGQRQLAVKISNPFRSRVMTGRIQASNPDRFLQDITTREFKIEPGQTGEVVFPLPGAAPAEGETYDFTLTVQTYAGYQDKRTHSLAFPPQRDKGPLEPRLP